MLVLLSLFFALSFSLCTDEVYSPIFKTDNRLVTQLYNYGQHSYNGPSDLAAISNTAIHYFYEDSEALYLVVVFDKKNDGSGGSIEMTVDFYPKTSSINGSYYEEAGFVVKDDPAHLETYTWNPNTQQIRVAATWESCCTDGFAFRIHKYSQGRHRRMSHKITAAVSYQKSQGISNRVIYSENNAVEKSHSSTSFRMSYQPETLPNQGSCEAGKTAKALYGYHQYIDHSSHTGMEKKKAAVHHFVKNKEGLFLFVTFSQPNTGSAGSVSAEFRMSRNDRFQPYVHVMDDPSSKDSRDKVTPIDKGFLATFKWNECCNDGIVFKMEEKGDHRPFCVNVNYLATSGISKFLVGRQSSDGKRHYHNMGSKCFAICYNPDLNQFKNKWEDFRQK